MNERMTEVWLRLRALFHRRQLDRDLEDELAFHREMREQELRNEGLPDGSARRSARRSFGNPTQIKEACREIWTFHWFETLWQDLRYGVRVLSKSPGFTAVAVLSLALGIGANTSIFTVINAVMLRSLPVQDPEELVVLNWARLDGKKRLRIGTHNSFGRIDRSTGLHITNTFAFPTYKLFQDRSETLQDVFAFTGRSETNFMSAGEARIVPGLFVSGNYFGALGVRPAAGRLLTVEDDKLTAELAAVISYELWQSAFGGSPFAVGSSVTVNSMPATIVGVTPRKFFGVSAGGYMGRPGVTLPLAFYEKAIHKAPAGTESDFVAARPWWVNVMGRLAPGATIESAQAELNSFFSRTLANLDGENWEGAAGIVLQPGGRGLDALRIYHSRELWILLAITSLVLLIACVNLANLLANLLLARAASRRKEITVRLAMGAGRWRVARQLLTESLLLSLAGAAAGLLVAYWGSRALVAMKQLPAHLIPAGLPEGPVLVFTAVAALLTTILFGLAPAFRGSRLQLAPALKAGAGTASSSPEESHRSLLARGLIVVQIGVSVVLLIGAGLCLQTLRNLLEIDVGFRTEGVLLFRVDPTLNNYDEHQVALFHRELQRRLKTIPGAISVGGSTNALLSRSSSNGPVLVPGAEHLEKERLFMRINRVTHDFLETMEVPLLLGRTPAPTDTAEVSPVIVINQAAARKAFPDGSPIGRKVQLFSRKSELLTIIGVVGDAKYTHVREEIPPTVYAPHEQRAGGPGALVYAVRTAGPPEAIIGHVRDALRRLDANVPMTHVKTQVMQIRDHLQRERSLTSLITVFGILAVVLSCIGIYGVMSYSVARRTSEIGVRMALGARSANIVWLVLRQTVLLTLIGAILGIAAGLAGARAIASVLYGLEAHDPLTLILAALLILVVAAAAGYIPASRAARIDPTVALRCE